VAVNMSRNDQETHGTANPVHTGGKQAQQIRNVRSGPWWVTILEIGKGIQDVPLRLVGKMLKLWEDKWATETENENWHELTQVDNNFHQMNPFYRNEYM
jgi:hypothetical protein